MSDMTLLLLEMHSMLSITTGEHEGNVKISSTSKLKQGADLITGRPLTNYDNQGTLGEYQGTQE